MEDDKNSPYAVLGLASGAGRAEIDAAYRIGLTRFRAALDAGSPMPADQLDRLRAAYRTLVAAAGEAQPQRPPAPPVVPEVPVAPVVQAVPAAPDSSPTMGFTFVGSGGDYFRIWIVNLILSVITAGIYSAWAKVRREQYFHRNTLLDGAGFDYHGNPQAILKGRLIAWGLLGLMSVSQRISPVLYGVLVVCAIPVLPWLLLRSIKFRAANTSYRGLRFHHYGSYGEALKVYVGHGLLALFTLGIWLPFWIRAIRRFQVAGLGYAGRRFTCTPPGGGFFGAYFLAGFAGFVSLVALSMAITAVVPTPTNANAEQFGMIIGLLLPLAFVLATMLAVRPILDVRLANLTWNASAFDGHRFASSQSLRSFWPLRAGNVLLVIVTLGLYWPWAKVREARYRLERLALDRVDWAACLGGEGGDAAAVGEEIADAFDLDFSL